MANKKISGEEIEWLSKNKQSIEKRNRSLKGAGVFFYCIALLLALSISVTLATHSALAFALIAFVIFLVLAAIFIVTNLPDKYAGEVVAGSISGIIIGTVIALIYISPMISIAQYPISMQVLYSNTTIIQNCTAFTNTNSGYLNGQPIGSKNTTSCSLPSGMAPDESNPFGCSIANKSIICSGTSPTKNVTWQGTILDVSKR